MSARVFEDAVQPFQVEDARVRGRMVRLGPALESILGKRGLPAQAEAMLAEAVTLAALLASGLDRKSTRLNSSHIQKSRMPSSA